MPFAVLERELDTDTVTLRLMETVAESDEHNVDDLETVWHKEEDEEALNVSKRFLLAALVSEAEGQAERLTDVHWEAL